MVTKIEGFDGQEASVKFRPTIEIEQRILFQLRTHNLSEQYQFTVMQWVEESLEKAGYAECSVLEFKRMSSNGSYIFKVEQTIGQLRF